MPARCRVRFSFVSLVVLTLAWVGVGLANAQEGVRTAKSPKKGNTSLGEQIPLERGYGPEEEGSRPAKPDVPPAAHWELTPEEEDLLDDVLEGWETKSGAVRTLKAKFTKRVYNNELLNKNSDPNVPTQELTGEIRYQKPDKAVYKEDGEEGEWWVCDGKALHEYRRSDRKVIERRLPAEMQGKAIFNSPLPFVFGVKAAKLKARYFMRVVTEKGTAGQIWLIVYPRAAQDAANFESAEVILDEKTMLPYAIQLNDNNRTSSASFVFENARINSVLGNIFEGIKVSTPFGWKREIVDMNAADDPDFSPETPGERARIEEDEGIEVDLNARRNREDRERKPTSNGDRKPKPRAKR